MAKFQAVNTSTAEPPKRGRPPRGSRPTVRDVARNAGVGISTVSRVINKSPLVKADKAERVLRVIQEMGYKFSPLVRRASRRKKGNLPELTHQAVCMLLTGHRTMRWITNCAPVYAYVLESVESALRLENVNCMIRNVPTPADLDLLKGMPVDGFIVLGASEWNDWPADLSPYPGISVMGEPGSGWGDCITYNNVAIGKLAAKYLLSRGCRHAAVAGFAFATRREVFVQAMTDAGAMACDLTRDGLIQTLTDINMADEAAFAACVEEFLSKTPRPDGLFITSDMVVPPLYRELERRGIVPGRDVQIVTCNNETAYLNQLKVQPAVVDIQSGVIGALAVRSLFWRIQNPDAPRQSILIEPVLRLPSE